MSETRTGTRTNGDAEFDALAELFLGDGEADGAGHRQGIAGSIGIAGARPEDGARDAPTLEPAPLVVEALVMGHLPVRTGPWLSQYAATIAREEERAVGMIRLGDSDVRVDVYGLRDRGALGSCESLEGALAAAAPHCRRWMVQVGDLDVPWLLRSSEVASVTLLAGGNEAAVVDAYRTIRRLMAGMEEAERTERGDAEAAEGLPRIQLAIMGADRDRAAVVAGRLRDASRAFLGREIELAARVEEMGPTGATPLFRGRATIGAREILERLRGSARARPEPRAARGVEPASAADTDHDAPAPEHRPIDVAWVGETDERQERGGERREEASMGSGVRPARGGWPGGLWAHVPGLEQLEIPYPDDPAIEFAIDADARLHVLRYEAGEAGGAVAALTAAGAWASKHVSLLNMAISPRGPIRLDATTALHLFTSRPAGVRGLLDAEVRVHALAPVVRDRDWVAVDLN